MTRGFKSSFSIRSLIDTNSSDEEMMDVEQSQVNNQSSNENIILPPTPPPSEELPNYTYATLIIMAIRSTPEQRMLLCNIYKWIEENFQTFVSERKNWKNQVRHTLSTHSCFIKIHRALDDPGRGYYWAINNTVDTGAVGGQWMAQCMRNSFSSNPYIHGVPFQHPLAAAAIYFPNPEEIKKEHEIFQHLYLQQTFYQQQFHQMQQ